MSSQTFEGQLDLCSVNANLILRDQKKFEGAEQPEWRLVGIKRKNEGRSGLIGTDAVIGYEGFEPQYRGSMLELRQK